MDEADIVDQQTSNVRTMFAPSVTVREKYTGGKCSVCPGGRSLACGAGDRVNLVDLASGDVVKRVELDSEDEVAAFCVRPVLSATGGMEVLVATKSLQLKHFRVEAEVECART